MFTQSAFIETTAEAKDHLEDLGYTCTSSSKHLPWLMTFPDKIGGYYLTTNNKPDAHKTLIQLGNQPINCCGKLGLFKAITALNDETDLHQLFRYQGKNEDSWFECDEDDIEFDRKASAHSCQSAWFHQSHKATVEELIELFNNITVVKYGKVTHIKTNNDAKLA